mgnify:CR=1 FL=1
MRKSIKLNLITFCLLNVINITYAEEQLDQIDVVEKIIANEKNHLPKRKQKARGSMFLKKRKALITWYGVCRGRLPNRIKAPVCCR